VLCAVFSTTVAALAQMTAAEHYQVGMTLGQAGKFTQAEKEFDAAVALSPKQPIYITALATAQFFQNKITEAEGNYQKALTLNPQDMLALLNLGTIYSRLGQYDKAVEEFTSLAQLDTKTSLPYHYLALAYSKLGDHQQEMSAYKQALAREPNKVDLLIDYGLAQASAEDYKGAKETFEYTAKIDPLNPQVNRLLQDIATKLGEEITVAPISSEDLSQAQKFYEEGLQLASEKKFDEAANAFESAVNKNPDDTQALIAWGAALTNAGNLSRGQELLQQAAEKAPNQQLAWYNLGINLALSGSPEDAIQALQQSLNLDKQFAPAWRQLARIYSAQKGTDPAEEAFKSAIDIDPAYLEARMDYAIFLLGLDRYADAMAQIEQSAKLNPDDPYLLLIRGLLSAKLGKPHEAEKWFKKSFELDPTNPQPLVCLGLLQLEQKHAGSAEESFVKALQIDNKDAEVWADLGDSQLAQEKYADAQLSFNRAISQNPLLFRAYLGLGLVGWGEKNLSAALEDFQWALAVGFYTETGSRTVVSNLPDMMLEAKRAILKMQESASTPEEQELLKGMIKQLEELEAGL
jgi:tetratricopeptide (TPR) repeat protein